MILILLLLAPAAQDPPPARFEGASLFGESELYDLVQKDLERDAREEDDTALDDAAFRIRHHYRMKGHAFARVEWSRGENGVFFSIEEGVRITPGRVHFTGNRALSNEVLEAQLARPPGSPVSSIPFSERLLNQQRDALLRVYLKRGYLDARIEVVRRNFDEADQEMHVTFRILEGNVYRLNREHSRGIPDLAQIGEYLAPLWGRPYDPDTPAALELLIEDHYREIGYPMARAEASPVIDAGTSTVALQVETHIGNLSRIAQIRIEGNEWTRKGFILSRADLEVGDLYCASCIRRAEERLRKTGLFRAIELVPSPMSEENPDVAIVIRVEEQEAGEVSVRGGYGTLDGPRFGAGAVYRNILGGAETLRIDGTYSYYRSRGSAEAALPFFLGTDLRPAFSVYYEEASFPSFDARAWGYVPSISMQVLPPLTVTGGLRLSFVETEEVEPGIPPGDLPDFDYRSCFISSRLDLRNNYLFPTRGLLAEFQTEWSGGPFDSDITFFKSTGHVAAYVPLPWGCVAAGSLHGGFIRPTEATDEIPIALRFFAGGTNTVRGFEYAMLGPLVNDEPTGGEAYGALQMELRFPIWSDLHGAVFTDRGNVWYRRDDFDLDDTRYSAGVGLRYHTPAGAMVVDVAWNPRREGEEKSVALHLSIGFPF